MEKLPGVERFSMTFAVGLLVFYFAFTVTGMSETA